MESIAASNNALNQAILDQILLQQELDALTQAQTDQKNTLQNLASGFSDASTSLGK